MSNMLENQVLVRKRSFKTLNLSPICSNNQVNIEIYLVYGGDVCEQEQGPNTKDIVSLMLVHTYKKSTPI